MRPGLDGSIKSKGEGAIGSPRGGILVCAGPVTVHPTRARLLSAAYAWGKC